MAPWLSQATLSPRQAGWARTGNLLLRRNQQVTRPGRRVNRLQRLVGDAGHEGNALNLLKDVNATAELLHSAREAHCQGSEHLTNWEPVGAPTLVCTCWSPFRGNLQYIPIATQLQPVVSIYCCLTLVLNTYAEEPGQLAAQPRFQQAHRLDGAHRFRPQSPGYAQWPPWCRMPFRLKEKKKARMIPDARPWPAPCSITTGLSKALEAARCVDVYFSIQLCKFSSWHIRSLFTGETFLQAAPRSKCTPYETPGFLHDRREKKCLQQHWGSRICSPTPDQRMRCNGLQASKPGRHRQAKRIR